MLGRLVRRLESVKVLGFAVIGIRDTMRGVGILTKDMAKDMKFLVTVMSILVSTMLVKLVVGGFILGLMVTHTMVNGRTA